MKACTADVYKLVAAVSLACLLEWQTVQLKGVTGIHGTQEVSQVSCNAQQVKERCAAWMGKPPPGQIQHHHLAEEPLKCLVEQCRLLCQGPLDPLGHEAFAGQ